jgi:hypothetical protein
MAAALMWLVDSLVIEAPVIGFVIGVGLIALHAATAGMLGGWARSALMWIPLINAVAVLVYMRSGEWDCYPGCSASGAAAGGILRVGIFLFLVGAAAAPLLAIRRSFVKRHASGP